MFGGSHTFKVQAAIFLGNDLTGGLIAWKGWSVHDRQTRFGDELPLPPLPQIQSGMFWDFQDPYVEPFMEIDDEPGYYINGEWTVSNRFLLRVTHYDNRTDPTAAAPGQVGWETEFNHVGLQATLPGDVDLIFQWLEGSTIWGPVFFGNRPVDNDFNSNFILLTRVFSRHRVSARYDHFEILDNDQTPLADNSEFGHAWTLAYQFEVSDHVSLAAEALKIFTQRNAWAYYGLDESKDERQLQLSVRLRFGN